MRYRLRTLLILLAIGPPVLALGWFAWQAWRPARREPIMQTPKVQLWSGELSLIPGTGQTVEPDEDEPPGKIEWQRIEVAPVVEPPKP
jgi:hypothetical protein